MHGTFSNFHFHKESGLSLIELMIALLIGVVLSFGAVNLFMHSKLSFLQDEQSARMQEGGRYAQRYLSREIAMSGFYGGVLRGGDIISNLDSGTDNCYDWLADTASSLEHFDNITAAGVGGAGNTLPSDCLDAGANDTLVPDTDLLVIRRVKDDTTFRRDQDCIDNSSCLSPPTFPSTKAYLRLEDYNVQVTLEAGDPGLTSPTSTPLDVWEYSPQILFIRDWSVAVGDGVPALCRKRIENGAMGATACMVEGVENLQVVFGIDGDDDYVPDIFESTPSEADVSLALVARFHILARTVNALAGYTNDKAYALGSEAVVAANDGFYRRVYQTTVVLRNSEALGI
jgi:type IV pilus assembly protein PilW